VQRRFEIFLGYIKLRFLQFYRYAMVFNIKETGLPCRLMNFPGYCLALLDIVGKAVRQIDNRNVFGR